MTANDRPDYLAQTLHQFGTTNDFSHIDSMHFGIEPGNKEVLNECRKFKYSKAKINVNPRKLGVSNNPYMTLKRVFKAGSKLNIYLEDDVLFSPDCLELAYWYDSLPNKNDYLCMTFFRKESLEDLQGVRAEYNPKMFSALGMVITDYQWENYFAPNWHKDRRGWDWSIKGVIENSGLGILVPMVSRSYHIGRERATHYVPAVHDKVHVGVKWNRDSASLKYRLIDDSSSSNTVSEKPKS